MLPPPPVAGLLMQPGAIATTAQRLDDAQDAPIPQTLPPNIFVVYDFSFLRNFFYADGSWSGPGLSGFDIETEGVLNPHDGEVSTLQIELNGYCWVVHVDAAGTLLDVVDVELFKQYLLEPAVCKCIHNAKFEIKWMMKYFGIKFYIENYHCTQICEYILAAGHGFGEPSRTSFEFDSSILSLGEIIFRRYKIVMDKDDDLRKSFRRRGLLEIVPPAKDPIKKRSDTCVVEGCTAAPTFLAGTKSWQVCTYHRENNKLVTALKNTKKWEPYPPRPVATQKVHGDLSVRQAMYAAFDVLYMTRLYDDQMTAIYNHRDKQGGQPYPALLKLDLECCEALASMEFHGIPVDTDQAFRTHMTLTWQANTLREEIIAELRKHPEEAAINPGSRDQMMPRLAEKFGINLPNYQTATLQRFVEHSIIKKILKWKQVDKLSDFTKAFLLERHPKTGCVHTNFNQTVTATARLSSSGPNLQNIPSKSKLSSEIRKCVQARPGYILAIADYSNIEVRLIAEVTRDPQLIALFAADQDMHCMTGSYMMGVSYEEMYNKFKVEKVAEFVAARNNSKCTNFSLGYKASVAKLQLIAWQQFGLDWSTEEATKQHTLWFSLYGGVKTWHDREGQAVREGSGPIIVENVLGRRRIMQRSITVQPTAKEKEDGKVAYQKGALPAVLNFPVQSASAEMTKRAMATLRRKVQIILQVHDELVLEVPTEAAENVVKLLHDAMVASGDGILTIVPNKVEPFTSSHWKK